MSLIGMRDVKLARMCACQCPSKVCRHALPAMHDGLLHANAERLECLTSCHALHIHAATALHPAMQAKRKRSEEGKSAPEDKAATGISLEDLAERMDVDWQARHCLKPTGSTAMRLWLFHKLATAYARCKSVCQ